MEITIKQYEIAVNNVAEISQVILDMEGGRFALAMFSELLHELLEEGDSFGAISVVRKLHVATQTPFEQIALDGDNTIVWSSLFSYALDDILEEGI